MMKKVALFLFCLVLPVLGFAQLEHAEMSMGWDTVNEYLIPEEGTIPPETEVSYTTYMGRLRLQNAIRFPLYELSYSMKDNASGSDLSDIRFAGLQKLPIQGMFLKGIYVESNPDAQTPTRTGGAYLMGNFSGTHVSLGFDHQMTEMNDESLYTLNLKRRYGPFIFMGGASHQPSDQQRYTAGGSLEFGDQFILGGIFGSWENDEGFGINFGRYNNRGDTDGLPSFALNYLDIPQRYKWFTFRIMWGSNGGHYSSLTFDNPFFSDFYGIDMGLMLTELIPNNYRHYDSPLLWKRLDEYGTVAFRVNYIDLDVNVRRLDSNLSVNTGQSFGPFKSIRGIFTFERYHNPAFGWQDDRYHLTAASWFMDKVFGGITYSSDFDKYNRVMLELRAITSF